MNKRIFAIVPALDLCLGGEAALAKDLSAMSRDEVSALQRRLTDAGCYQGALDGRSSAAVEAAVKACPDQEPILRIETGMHTGVINRIAADAACRIAATGSDDKTVRLWSLPDGRLIRTQRLPVGEGSNGRVYAIAVSPDGRRVAAGGWDAYWGRTKQHRIYLFDSAGGNAVRLLGKFDHVARHLAFSADGTRLAVALATEGVRVYEVETGRELMADRDYKRDSFGISIGSDGS